MKSKRGLVGRRSEAPRESDALAPSPLLELTAAILGIL